MKTKIIIIVYFLVITSCKQLDKKERKQTKPNIILIMADDMGYSDLGCYGSEITRPTLTGWHRMG
jgi:arylsulfatase